MIDLLFAQDPGQPQAVPFWLNPMFLLAMMVLFWVVVILPMSRRQRREQQQMLAALKRGTRVLTTGGVVGTVVTAKENEDEIVIRSEDTRLRIKRHAVAQVLGTDESETSK